MNQQMKGVFKMDISRLKARRGYTNAFNCAVEDYNNTE